jgi:HEAT repeat protein
VKRAIDAPNNVAQTAIDAIARMGEAGKPLIEPALKKLGDKENPYARFAAIGLVGTLPPAQAAKVAADVGKLATDSERDIRSRAASVLEQLGPAGASAAPALSKALATEMDEAIRDQFVDALIAMGPGAKPALPALLPLASDATLPVGRREKLIAAIVAADPSSKEVADALVMAASEKDQSIRAAAALALGKLNPLPPQALAKLVAIAKSDPRTDPRGAALRALAEAGPRAKSARSEIEALVNAKHRDGLELLAKIALAAMDGDAAKAAAAVRAGLADKKPDVRAAAVGALVDLGPKPGDLPALTKLLKDRDEVTREAAVRCLGRLGTGAKELIPVLGKMLASDLSPPVRIAAATALGEIGPAARSAIPALKKAVNNDTAVAPAARKALEKLGVREKK